MDKMHIGLGQRTHSALKTFFNGLVVDGYACYKYDATEREWKTTLFFAPLDTQQFTVKPKNQGQVLDRSMAIR